MKNNEEYEVNAREMTKQLRELNLEGDYARLEIIIGKDSNIPYCAFEGHSINSEIMAKMLVTIDAMKKELSKRDPIAAYMTTVGDIEVADSQSIDLDREDLDNEDN